MYKNNKAIFSAYIFYSTYFIKTKKSQIVYFQIRNATNGKISVAVFQIKTNNETKGNLLLIIF